MANQLPQPPAFLVRPPPPAPRDDSDPLAPLGRFFDYAAERGIDVVMVAPPTDRPVLLEEIRALCEQRGVGFLDYSEAPLPSHNSHLNVKGARIYSTRLARDLKKRGY